MHQQPNEPPSLALGAAHEPPPAELGDGARLPEPDDRGHPRPARRRDLAAAGAAVRPAGVGRQGAAADDTGVRAALATHLQGGAPWPVGTSLAHTSRGRAGPDGRRGRGRTSLAPTVRGHGHASGPGCWSCWACGGAGRKDAPTGRATTPAGSVAPTSEHSSESRAIPLPIPPHAPEGWAAVSTAQTSRSEVPSPGVGRKKRGRPPGSRWCGPSKWVLLRRPAGEEMRPANPMRAATGDLAGAAA
jgi:hypothetical protein